MQTSGGDCLQRELGADVVPGEQGPGASDLAAKAGDHLGEPVRGVRVARPVLGIAVKREVGQHDPKARGQLAHDRLPFPVRQPQRMKQCKGWTSARFAVRYPGAIMMVVEPESHVPW